MAVGQHVLLFVCLVHMGTQQRMCLICVLTLRTGSFIWKDRKKKKCLHAIYNPAKQHQTLNIQESSQSLTLNHNGNDCARRVISHQQQAGKQKRQIFYKLSICRNRVFNGNSSMSCKVLNLVYGYCCWMFFLLLLRQSVNILSHLIHCGNGTF